MTYLIDPLNFINHELACRELTIYNQGVTNYPLGGQFVMLLLKKKKAQQEVHHYILSTTQDFLLWAPGFIAAHNPKRNPVNPVLFAAVRKARNQDPSPRPPG